MGQEISREMIQGPMRASMDDFDSIIELADECFPGDRDSGGMLARWPHCYIRKPEAMRNYLIMKDGPKVISQVGYIDQSLLVEGDEVKVAGITGVATSPNYRRQGLMTKLLNVCIKMMRDEGYAFSDLGGDRQRYARFGWERAGRQWLFDITPRSLHDVDAPKGYHVNQYGARPDEIDSTFSLHAKEFLGVKRTRSLHEVLLGRKGKEVWLVQGREGIVAYAVADPGEKDQEIVEFGGTSDGMHALLMHLTGTLGSEMIRIYSPWSHPLNPLFFSLSSRWHVNCQRMIRILDLEATLRGFAHQLGRRHRQLGLQGSHNIALGIEGTDQLVEIEFSPEGLLVRRATSSAGALMLPEGGIVRLLFGPGTPSAEFTLPPRARFLDGLLPLDLYIWVNEAV
jgi:GNAT superfamily N-acetyltransferase